MIPRIEQVFAKAQEAFAKEASQVGLEVFKGFVPIDTHTLQESIAVKRKGRWVIFEVPKKTLTYPDRQIKARRLALILEIGTGKAGVLLHRTQSNRYPGTEQGVPTVDWFDKAIVEVNKQLRPIVARIVAEAYQEVQRIILHG